MANQGAEIPEEWLSETKTSGRKSLLMHKLQLAKGKGKMYIYIGTLKGFISHRI